MRLGLLILPLLFRLEPLGFRLRFPDRFGFLTRDSLGFLHRRFGFLCLLVRDLELFLDLFLIHFDPLLTTGDCREEEECAEKAGH